MTKITVLRRDLIKFLSFTKGIPDLRIDCEGARLTTEVAYAWYYLKKTMMVPPAAIEESGTIHIANLEKFNQFLKASKSDFVTIRQVAITKPLHVVGGANKYQIPSTDDIESAAKVPAVRNLLAEGWETGWHKMGDITFDAHGTVDATDLTSLADMRTLVSKESSFRLRLHAGESELGLVAGKAINGRLFTTLPITNAIGPNSTIQSNYGEWLWGCLQYLDEDDVRVHLAEDSFAVFEQPNTLLMVVDLSED